MKCRVFLAVFILTALLAGFSRADERFQYGFKFGIVQNGFNMYPSGENPFSSVDLDSRMGFMAGAFYDWQAFQKASFINIHFGAAYKLLRVSGNFETADATPVVGEFTNYYHLIDAPIGVKFLSSRYKGRPFAGVGLQMDFIVAESQSVDLASGSETAMIDTTPDYSSRVNTGFYIHGGFEIPSASYFYVVEVKYINWTRDNYKPETSFFGRDKNELQVTFGIKIR